MVGVRGSGLNSLRVPTKIEVRVSETEVSDDECEHGVRKPLEEKRQ